MALGFVYRLFVLPTCKSGRMSRLVKLAVLKRWGSDEATGDDGSFLFIERDAFVTS